MNFTLPKGAKQKLSPHLYYSKYPFKLVLERIGNKTLPKKEIDPKLKQKPGVYWRSDSYRLNLNQTRQFAQWFLQYLPDDATSYRKRIEYRTVTYYFETEADVEKFLVGAEPQIKSGFNIELCTMSDDQADAARLDAKIEYKKTLYHKKYVYRMQVKGGDEELFETLEAQFFEEEDVKAFNERLEFLQKALDRSTVRNRYRNKIEKRGRNLIGTRARMTYGHSYGNTILFLVDEQDAALARLIINSKTKISKAVVA